MEQLTVGGSPFFVRVSSEGQIALNCVMKSNCSLHSFVVSAMLDMSSSFTKLSALNHPAKGFATAILLHVYCCRFVGAKRRPTLTMYFILIYVYGVNF